jgi:hypothetical protein
LAHRGFRPFINKKNGASEEKPPIGDSPLFKPERLTHACLRESFQQKNLSVPCASTVTGVRRSPAPCKVHEKDKSSARFSRKNPPYSAPVQNTHHPFDISSTFEKAFFPLSHCRNMTQLKNQNMADFLL